MSALQDWPWPTTADSRRRKTKQALQNAVVELRAEAMALFALADSIEKACKQYAEAQAKVETQTQVPIQ